MAYTLTTDKTWAQTEAELKTCLKRWGAKEYSVARGSPKPNQQPPGMKSVGDTPAPRGTETPEEATVTLVIRWAEPTRPDLTLCYNQQRRAVDNIRVLYLACEALRLNELRGIDDLLREAYLQLPPASGAEVILDPYAFFGVARDVEKDDLNALVRSRSARAQGDQDAQKKINLARDAIYVERGWK